MVQTLATGQITIIDYNDGVGLSGFIGLNVSSRVQVYNPDNQSYFPNWGTSPYLILTPSLFVQGNGTDIIKSTQVKFIKWYDASVSTTVPLTGNATYAVSNPEIAPVNGNPLTIKTNLLTEAISSKDYICEVIYEDPTTLLRLTQKIPITLSRVVNGGGLVNAVVNSPSGNIFKNDVSPTLPLSAELWRGGIKDTTNVEYRWYVQNGSTDDGIGGSGFEYITTGNPYGITGFGSPTINVPNSAVTSIEVFKCVIKDIEIGSVTKDKYFSGTIVLVDQTDPLTVTVTSSGGEVFKNGDGASTLKAIVRQNGVIVDAAGTTYNYRWSKYGNDGLLDTSWKTGGSILVTTTNELSITGADVLIKGTFSVNIETKT